MANRLGDAISPYLRSHSDNPVDWFPWGEEAFAEAVRRDVPVLVSIGYSTCHWCHVMARESFSDPALAAELNRGFVAIKVDREEHPEVDSVYLAAAGAFTQNLGWPLNVFVTPQGRAFFAGTYSPPVAVQGNPSFRQVLAAVEEAWTTRRADVESTAAQLLAALVAAGAESAASEEPEAEPVRDEPEAEPVAGDAATPSETPRDAPREAAARDLDDGVPTTAQLAQVVFELDAYEDTVYGGFGTAPKFPVAPVLQFLQAMDAPVADRALQAMAQSALRDPVEGGFFRYATRQDWSDPHYERMLYDNALLLDAYTTAAERHPEAEWSRSTAEGIASYLVEHMQQPAGGFASAQDSESTVAGERTEGGYYGLDAEARRGEEPPAFDLKILTGWNGLAIGALAHAGTALGEERFIDAARRSADYLLSNHLRSDGSLVRASLEGRVSDARATLEDYGMFATALLELGSAAGEERYRSAGARLLDSILALGSDENAAQPWGVPGGGDPVLAARGLLLEGDVSEGAYPSGNSAAARAAYLRYRETGDDRYRQAVLRALVPVAADALSRPIGFGAALELLVRLRAETPAG